MSWCTRPVSPFQCSLTLFILFGILQSTSSELNITDRIPGIGSIDCPEFLTVQFNSILERPPYVGAKQNNSDEYDGLFPTFLQIMLDECCRFSSNLVYNSSAEDPDINVPVIVNLEADYNANNGERNFVPMLPHTGIAFVVVKSSKSEQSWRIIKPLLATWPVLILILLFSLLAGIIAWSLETRKNPDNFPSMFTKGMWEGFWWAFISMTTVGYGDRYPKSIGGRIFAVLWILVGMVIVSIFTAALTSSLTTLSLETKLSLPGAKVLTFFGSIESITGFQQQANLTRVETAREIHTRLESGQFQGALMDAYFMAHFKANYPTSKLKIQEVIQQKNLEYGARVKNKELAECFREKRYTQEFDLYENAVLILGHSLSSEFESEDNSDLNLFDPEGLMYFPVIFTCLGVTAFLVLAGGAWDLYHTFNCFQIKRRRESSERFVSISLKKNNLDKYYVSQEKLRDLERKIQELNQAFELLQQHGKNGKIFNNVT